MSMTANRRRVYSRSWYRRECKFNMRRRRKEYNRKIRYAKISEDLTSKALMNLRKLEWNTITWENI